MAGVVKIHSRIWNHSRFAELSERDQVVYFFLVTHPQLTALGAMRATIVGLAAEFGWPASRFRKSCDELVYAGLVRFAENAPLVWLPQFLTDNRPESPKLMQSWEALVDGLPECPELLDVLLTVQAFAETWGEAFWSMLPNNIRRVIPIAAAEPRPSGPAPVIETPVTTAAPVAETPAAEVRAATGRTLAADAAIQSFHKFCEENFKDMPAEPANPISAASAQHRLIVVPIPKRLRQKQFLNAWMRWTRHCREHRPEFTYEVAENQLFALSQLDIERGTAAVESMLRNSEAKATARGKPPQEPMFDFAI